MAPTTTLLIVDDTPNVGRALVRLLGRRFDRVIAVTSAAEAAAVLDREQVTHVACDQNLAPGDPPGLTLVPRWREEYPSIERAIILSGANERTLRATPGVDAIASKLVDSRELYALLTGSPS